MKSDRLILLRLRFGHVGEKMMTNLMRSLMGTCLLSCLAIGPSATDAAIAGEYSELIPQHLLGLVHAPEVHDELRLSSNQIESLEELFREVDAIWFPARLQPAEKQFLTIAELERQVWQWFHINAKSEQHQRLQQLEYYAQSGRMLLRDDIGKGIGLDASQQESLAELARTTDEIRNQFNRTQFGDPNIQNLQSKLTDALNAERAGLKKYVRPKQREKLTKLLGVPFDPSRLQRIYAMAPEFADTENWINSSPLRMAELRGKVVIIHFYAFQCHNCHANFDIYKRWHKELTDEGVVLVGIQTPETSRERDPNAVKIAAKDRGLKFPILVDLKSENWKAWGNTMWPCVYVVDKHGYIRHWWQGEMNWKGATADETIENVVEDLLAEN